MALPWKKETKDRLDLNEAQKVLDEDHYGLKKVKDRIIEYLAVKQLTNSLKGPILCFVGLRERVRRALPNPLPAP